MTPSQQAALEVLAGRALTSQEIADAGARKDATVAGSLSVGRTLFVPTFIGIGAILATLGATAGAAVLDALTAISATNRPLYWAMQMLSQKQLDVSDPNVAVQMAALVSGGALTQEQATSILNLAAQPAPVSVSAVSDILNEA